jgi:hypothetical protein
MQWVMILDINVKYQTYIKQCTIRQLDLQLPMQSVPITTDVVSSNLDQGEVYNIMLDL